jgi:hypothetical protein
MSERHGHPFSAVDDQPAPDSWVVVLDRVRQEPFHRAYKARAMELLAPRPGRERRTRPACWTPTTRRAGRSCSTRSVASGRFLHAVTFFLTAGTRPAGAGPR